MLRLSVEFYIQHRLVLKNIPRRKIYTDVTTYL